MANHSRLPPNATLRSVLQLLENPLEFVRQAWGVINTHHRSNGPAVLRLGISQASKGKRPNYVIENSDTKEILASIDGNNHKTWQGETANPQGDWSTEIMTYDEMKALLNELRATELRR
jgi:hypothetical protein